MKTIGKNRRIEILLLACLLLLSGFQGGCDEGSDEEENNTAGMDADSDTDSDSDTDADTDTDTDSDSDTDTDSQTEVPQWRLVAIADLHGDMNATRNAFTVAGVIDDADEWIGGDTVIVQTGDILDRWFQEREIMDWMEALREKALAAGGDIVMLAGNHEDNNLEAYYADLDERSCEAYNDLTGEDTSQAALSELTEECLVRGATLLPGGGYAMNLAEKKVAVIMRDTVFVHGGILPEHVNGPEDLDDINERWAEFARGEAGALVDQDIYDILWDRTYSDGINPDCEILEEVLSTLQVSRMVVGHTPWNHINSRCDERIWRIDTGMSEYYGGVVEVLEISDLGIKVLTE